MSASSILLIIASYFGLLLLISYLTSGKSNSNTAFFIANKQSPWYLVAFGMIGASLSGVTFISVPGWVKGSQFSYMQIVFGYLLGYLVVANILLPLYYRLKLVSIYAYLEQRFGALSYRTGALFFILSRVVGASFRLFLVAGVLQYTIFDQWHIPFALTSVVTVLLIWVYTHRSGLNTIIWTDTLQTFFMLTAVIISIFYLLNALNLDVFTLKTSIQEAHLGEMFYFSDWKSPQFFWKQFISGAFITIVMTGLDQDMMQKNLSCKNIKEAKKNMYWFSLTLIPVNLVFLILGALLYIYAQQNGISIPQRADLLYPQIAMSGTMGWFLAAVFMIGLVASAYSSADSALTSLTTSYALDIAQIDKKYSAEQQVTKRKQIHLAFSAILALTIIIFNLISDDSVIKLLFDAAGYTYGPLLGLFSFGLFTKYQIKDQLAPYVLCIAPLLTALLKWASVHYQFSYQIGFELLIINGLISFFGLFFIREKLNS